MLVDARASSGMTLQQVSASTKIPVSKLRAIERDEIENLPGGIFTRGFVRSYAEAVGLDPQETLAQFEARFPEESSVASLHATIEGRANEEFVKQQKTAKGLIWFALLLMPLVVWLVSVVVLDDRQPPAPPEVSDEARLSEGSGGQPESLAAGVPEDASPAEPATGADAVPVVPAAAAELTMQISATGDCWVQASADGDTVVSRILRASEQDVIVAQRAIELRIGDAGVFAYTINQRPGRSLGASGEVVNVRVTPSNYLSFVAD